MSNTQSVNGPITLAKRTGAILAGGQARRMQKLGQFFKQEKTAFRWVHEHYSNPSHGCIDKGLLLLQKQPLVAWQCQLLRPKVQQLVINANQNQSFYATYGRVVADDPGLPQSQGPLIGILSVLKQSATPWVVFVPIDSPFLPVDYVDRLVFAQKQEPGHLAYYCHADRDYPLCLLAHVNAQRSLKEYIGSGQRRVMPWLKKITAAKVSFRSEQAAWFTNINTPEDYMAAMKQLS